MGVYLITFDLKNASERSYEAIYEWAHRLGGHRYFQFPNGRWGRLPSTTVVVPLAAKTNAAARDEFQTALEKANYTPTHIAVAEGSNRTAFSTVIPEWEIPEYAKRRAMAGV